MREIQAAKAGHHVCTADPSPAILSIAAASRGKGIAVAPETTRPTTNSTSRILTLRINTQVSAVIILVVSDLPQSLSHYHFPSRA